MIEPKPSAPWWYRILRGVGGVAVLAILAGPVSCARDSAQSGLTPESGGGPESAPAALELTEEQATKWARFWEEQEALKLLMEVSAAYRAGDLAIEGVTVLPMTGEGPLANQTVLVRGGRIAALGPRAGVTVPAGARVADGAGKFLVPGLTDAHTHTISSPSQFLVYLTRGVTHLREMDGFPWMLAAREKARAGKLLIPNLYITGHILSHRSMAFFMTQVDTEAEARALVREQAAAGYDFIKIHNSMPEPLFSAVFDAAREVGLDVVGHIPNEIPIADAVAAGMVTNEHFKGYIFDQTLEITEQDYLAATRGSELWNTPTFVTYHDHLRGDEALASIDLATLALVPRWLRKIWSAQSDQPVDRLTELRQAIYPKSREIYSNLARVTDRFLAGTDTGTYANMVPGETLLEEVRIFEELGMSPREALATATVNPARAFGRADELGTVEVGRRADFVLLDADPLRSAKNLANPAGVSVRGVWLDREALGEIESRLAAIFADDRLIPAPTSTEFETLVREMAELEAAGLPYPNYFKDEIASFLRSLGHGDLMPEEAQSTAP